MKNNRKYSLDVNKVIDWERQRTDINERISSGDVSKPKRGRYGWAFAYVIVAAVLVALVSWQLLKGGNDRREALENYYAGIEDISVDDRVPRSLYVLNGFGEDEYVDIEETMDDIIPSYDGEEGL